MRRNAFQRNEKSALSVASQPVRFVDDNSPAALAETAYRQLAFQVSNAGRRQFAGIKLFNADGIGNLCGEQKSDRRLARPALARHPYCPTRETARA
jgi:hypothetical protein